MYHIKPVIPVERFRIVTEPLFQKKTCVDKTNIFWLKN